LFLSAKTLPNAGAQQQELERRHQTLQALSTVGRVLTASLDLNHVLSAIVQSVSELFHTSATAVLLYDANAHRLSIAAQIGNDESLVSDLRIDVEREGITGLAVLRREPIYVPDVTKEPRYIKGAENVRTELALPLVVAGHVVGVLDVQDPAVNAFDDEKVAVLAQFADYAAIAIENAQLYQQTLWRVKELFALNEVMRLSLARMTFEDLTVSTAEMLSQQFAYDGVSVYAVVSDEEIRCLCRYLDGEKVSGENSNLPIGHGIIGWVAREGVALIVNDTSQDARFVPCADIDARSELAVPIKLEGRVIAVLNIDSRKQHAFTNNDLAMVNTIAAQLSSAYERTRLVEQINASQRQYQNLYDNAPDMYQTLDEEGRILLCNETMAATLGYRKDELLGKHVVQFIPEELHPKVREAMKKVMTEGEVFDFESQLRTRNGTMIDVVVNARLDVRSEGTRTILATMRDVTEKKKKEFELMRLASIVSNSPDCVFITDRNGVIEYVNPAFEHTTGYTSAEVIGKTARILKSGKHDRKFYETLWNTILDGKVWRGQFVNRKKNGELYYDDRIIAPLRDAEGNIVNFIATGRDVTERKLLEEQLLQAQKLESVGTLASGIAHDFNNILNNVIGFTGSAQEIRRRSRKSTPLRRDDRESGAARC
jgi:PAS domain S-box-containing protein